VATQLNVAKRLVRSPRVYVRDTGLVHALLGLGHGDDLLGHPVVEPSGEGFVIESLIAIAPAATHASFHQTSGEAGLDLVLALPNRETWAIEFRLGLSPKLSRGFSIGRANVEQDRSSVVYSGADRVPLAPGVEAISRRELSRELDRLG
jgi:uncharacterized protein